MRYIVDALQCSTDSVNRNCLRLLDSLFIQTVNDATGRNLAHKAVIYQKPALLTAILRLDEDGDARKSRDAVSNDDVITKT